MTGRVAVTDRTERERFCALPGLSELTPEILDRHRPDLSLALQDVAGQFVARCSLWWTEAPPLAGQRLGAIGHYAALDALCSARLLDHACDRLAAQACTLAVGPMDGNTWRRYRLLTERGTEPPFFLEPDNPDDYPAHFTSCGFASLAEYYSAVNEDLAQSDPHHEATEHRCADNGISIRPIALDRFEDELRAIHALSLVSFADNFLYTPIGADEFLAQYSGIRPYIQPHLVLLAERAGQLAGFMFIVPDLQRSLRGRPIDTVIFKTMAVHPAHRGAGLGSLLMALGHQAAHRLGFRRAIHALMHEKNASRTISGHTARTMRRYTLFSRPLGGSP